MEYIVTKRVFGFDETKTEKFVVTPLNAGEVSYNKLCKQIVQICGAHRGIVQLVTAGLIDAMINNLEDGKSVRLGDFGIFRPTLKTHAANSEEEANTSCIQRRRINFTPGKLFKEALNDMSVTRAATPKLDWTQGADGDSGAGNNGGVIDPDA